MTAKRSSTTPAMGERTLSSRVNRRFAEVINLAGVIPQFPAIASVHQPINSRMILLLVSCQRRSEITLLPVVFCPADK
jgi:hypothetical protein